MISKPRTLIAANLNGFTVSVFCTSGIASRTNIDNSTTVQCSSQFNKLCKLARNCIRELDPENDLTFLRIRTKKNEVMCAAGNGRKSNQQ